LSTQAGSATARQAAATAKRRTVGFAARIKEAAADTWQHRPQTRRGTCHGWGAGPRDCAWHPQQVGGGEFAPQRSGADASRSARCSHVSPTAATVCVDGLSGGHPTPCWCRGSRRGEHGAAAAPDRRTDERPPQAHALSPAFRTMRLPGAGPLRLCA
jgi:hypothetical protein